jgi:hypothetical protein
MIKIIYSMILWILIRTTTALEAWVWAQDFIKRGGNIRDLWREGMSDEAREGEAKAIMFTMDTPGWGYIMEYMWKEREKELARMSEDERKHRDWDAGFIAGMTRFLILARAIIKRYHNYVKTQRPKE